ncbi:MAG: chemotactic signal-response protein chel [Sneathiella sp.]|uniref:rod-binding protein n=1 Tax=Sneathiella sp. TaxID=1964365 RepID=UPI000C353C17|nr:rod-binding protein [Sneathiella sp.]MAZ03337.1 chemotactic signal-response protein chel [Sneathiella sp.]
MTDIQTAAPKFLVEQGTTNRKDTVRNEEQIRETAREFEAFFLSQVLNSMSSGLETDSMFGGGESEKMFRGMLNDEYSKSMSRNNSVGIADAVYREMLALQEVK